MYILFTILIVIASILLTLLVLVQNSKGGGLASGFASSNQVLGVRKTTDFLEKATWTLVAVVLLLSVPDWTKQNRKQNLHLLNSEPIPTK
jgi:preprotein translocase subunit SecG